jgi:dipeptide/tripeptide permease
MGEPIVNDATVKRDWFGQPRGLPLSLLTGNILAVRTDQHIERSVTSMWLMPMIWFQAINPLIIFVLTPRIVLRWKKLATVGREWSATTDMVFGSLVIAASYLTSRNKTDGHPNRHAGVGVSMNEQRHVALRQQVTRR